MVVIFVPKESAAGETRVAAVPETVKGMQKLSLTVQVERGAGLASGFTDAAYEEAGATLVDADARNAADIVLGIQVPTADLCAAQKAGAMLGSSFAAFHGRGGVEEILRGMTASTSTMAVGLLCSAPR